MMTSTVMMTLTLTVGLTKDELLLDGRVVMVHLLVRVEAAVGAVVIPGAVNRHRRLTNQVLDRIVANLVLMCKRTG